MGFSIVQAARFCRLELIDYARGRGVLLSSGCGLMLAVMDQAAFRWCVDTDRLTAAERARLADFVRLVAPEPVGVCGWFSYSDPAPLLDAACAADTSLCYFASPPRGGYFSLHSFISACRAAVGPVAAYSAPYSRGARR